MVKRNKTNKEHLDRFSNIPDNVLLKILSFLPTSDAVKTVSLRRFGNLWRKIRSFHFDEYEFQPKADTNDEEKLQCFRFLCFIDDVMMLQRENNVQKFRLTISKTFYSDMVKWNVAKRIETWLRQVKSSNVEVLELSFSMVEPGLSKFPVPSEIFKSRTIVKLVLENCDVKVVGVHMPSLQIMTLDKVPLGQDDLQEFVSGCPMLRDLTLANCEKLLEVRFRVQNIQRLKIVKDEISSIGIRIHCSSVKHFEFVGFLEHLKRVFLPDVSVVTLDLKANIRLPEVLTISSCVLQFNCKLLNVKKGGDLTSVRSLSLENVFLSDQLLTEIVSACVTLEELSVTNCRGLTEISFPASRLACLTLVRDDKTLLKINCPNLDSLTFSGSIESVEVINLMSLRNANIDVKFGKLNWYVCFLFRLFLNKIPDAQVLTLSRSSFQAFTYWGPRNSCPANNWKHVILKTCLQERHIPLLCHLFEKSLRLEELTIHDIDCLEDLTEDRDFKFSRCDKELNYTCLKEHLKKVTIKGGSSRSYKVHYQIADIIRKNASVLEAFVLCPRLE